jgi:succinate-semialdehyde dehydrogenase/glutarate-semialdehyde dehydrogenase
MSHLWINGQNCNATDGALYDIHSPANGRVIGQAAAASVADIEKAIASAEAAFVIWSNKTAYERETIMRGATAQVRTQAEEIGRLMALEQGKPWSQATGEVHGACDMIDYYASEAPRIEGTLPPTEKSSFRSWVTHHPVGVCAGITPWNYPVALLSWKLGPALAAGCAMVVKPTPVTPLSPLAFCQALTEGGVPVGLINVLTGPDAALGEALVGHPGIAKVAMTGSTRVGKQIFTS